MKELLVSTKLSANANNLNCPSFLVPQASPDPLKGRTNYCSSSHCRFHVECTGFVPQLGQRCSKGWTKSLVEGIFQNRHFFVLEQLGDISTHKIHFSSYFGKEKFII